VVQTRKRIVDRILVIYKLSLTDMAMAQTSANHPTYHNQEASPKHILHMKKEPLSNPKQVTIQADSIELM